MWHTPSGVRYLKGAEAELLKAAIGLIWDFVEIEADSPEDRWSCGVGLFDGLDCRQRIAMLAFVSNALFREDIPAPALTAINEATIGAIFESVVLNIELEIDAERLDVLSDDPKTDERYWRRRVRAAFVSDGEPLDFPLPADSCCDRDEWDVLVECLADAVLWDDDWLDEGFIMDVDPETARARKKRLGIKEDYYLALAPDPTGSELDQARQLLDELLPKSADP